MALDTKAKRAAAIGFGSLALVLPVAIGALDIPSAGQALGAYVWDYADSDIAVLGVVIAALTEATGVTDFETE